MTASPVQTAGLPHGRLTCKTCGLRFTFARDLVEHIVEVRRLAELAEAELAVTAP